MPSRLESTDVCEIPLGRLMEVAEQVPAVRRIVYRFLSDEIAHHHALLQPLSGKMAAAGSTGRVSPQPYAGSRRRKRRRAKSV